VHFAWAWRDRVVLQAMRPAAAQPGGCRSPGSVGAHTARARPLALILGQLALVRSSTGRRRRHGRPVAHGLLPQWLFAVELPRRSRPARLPRRRADGWRRPTQWPPRKRDAPSPGALIPTFLGLSTVRPGESRVLDVLTSRPRPHPHRGGGGSLLPHGVPGQPHRAPCPAGP